MELSKALIKVALSILGTETYGQDKNDLLIWKKTKKKQQRRARKQCMADCKSGLSLFFVASS